MSALNPGRLRQRVTIQSLTETRTSTSGMTKAWATLAANVPAEVLPTSARERLAADQVAAEISHVVTMRYRSGITAKHRLLYDGRSLAIRGVIDVEQRHRWIELTCTEEA